MIYGSVVYVEINYLIFTNRFYVLYTHIFIVFIAGAPFTNMV